MSRHSAEGWIKSCSRQDVFFLKNAKFLGHVISPDGIQLIAKRVDALRNLKSPQSKQDVMKVSGCLGFYSCYIKNLHVDSQPCYDLIKDSTQFQWTEEHEELFNFIKDRIHKDRVLAVPNTRFISMWTLPTSVEVVSSSNNSLRERELSRLTLVYLTKQNKRCPPFTENYVESYHLSRHTNTAISDPHFPFISIAIRNQFFIYGDASDNSRIAFSDTK